jgi:hypothetical protein
VHEASSDVPAAAPRDFGLRIQVLEVDNLFAVFVELWRAAIVDKERKNLRGRRFQHGLTFDHRKIRLVSNSLAPDDELWRERHSADVDLVRCGNWFPVRRRGNTNQGVHEHFIDGLSLREKSWA